MRKRLGWCMAAGLAAALICAACTQTTTRTTTITGDPPQPGQDVTPKINATTYFAHAHLLERQGNLEKAVEQYEQALKAQPDFVTALNRLGITLNKLGRHAEATQRFERAISLAPNSAFLYNNIGFSLYLEGRYNEAEAAFVHAVQLKPDFVRANMNLGMTLGKLERFEESLAAFKATGDEATAYYNLAVVESDTGHYVDAVKALGQALAINPSFDAAREHMQEIAEAAAAQEAAQKIAQEQQAFHRTHGSLTDEEIAAFFGDADSHMTGPEGATLTAVEPTLVAPDTAGEMPPVPPMVETISPIDGGILEQAADRNCEEIETSTPAQRGTATTEADYFAIDDQKTSRWQIMRDDRMSLLIRRIDELTSAAVNGVMSWAEAYCELDALFDAHGDLSTPDAIPSGKEATTGQDSTPGSVSLPEMGSELMIE